MFFIILPFLSLQEMWLMFPRVYLTKHSDMNIHEIWEMNNLASVCLYPQLVCWNIWLSQRIIIRVLQLRSVLMQASFFLNWTIEISFRGLNLQELLCSCSNAWLIVSFSKHVISIGAEPNNCSMNFVAYIDILNNIRSTFLHGIYTPRIDLYAKLRAISQMQKHFRILPRKEDPFSPFVRQ